MRKKDKRDRLTQDVMDETSEDMLDTELLSDEAEDETYETAEAAPEEDLLAEDQKDLQIAELSDKYIRLMAEYDNFRRRSQKEKDQLYERSITDVVGEWLPVVDNLERALKISETSESGEVQQFREGLNLVMRQVEKSLLKLKVTVIDPLGETFDPNLHSAVLHIDDEQYEASEVVEVFEKGYVREGTVIRHAVVKVAN